MSKTISRKTLDGLENEDLDDMLTPPQSVKCKCGARMKIIQLSVKKWFAPKKEVNEKGLHESDPNGKEYGRFKVLYLCEKRCGGYKTCRIGGELVDVDVQKERNERWRALPPCPVDELRQATRDGRERPKCSCERCRISLKALELYPLRPVERCQSKSK